MKSNINLAPYHGIEASVNSYLFFDEKSAILVDCLRNSNEARLLAAFVKAHNKPLITILITHGHPDHYIGIDIMRNEFPETPIVVTKKEIKDDIIAFSNWMEKVGWLDKEPSMKPRSNKNLTGFDYDNNINVLNTNELKLLEGAVLELNSSYEPSECEHLTTIYSKDLNAFFTGDFCYNDVHVWLAVDKKNIVYWIKQLDDFKKSLSRIDPIIYPGHGKSSDLTLFDKVKRYIEDFEATIKIAKSREDAMRIMESHYPNYQQKDFILLNSVNASLSS